MLTFTYFFCPLVFLWTPVDLYNAHRPYIYCNPANNEDTCQYYENPLLVPIFETRINIQKCCPVYSPRGCPKCADGIHKKRNINLNPRSSFHGSKLLHSGAGINSVFPKDNKKFDYLNLNKNLKSLGDLMELSSDEMEFPRPVLHKAPTKLWKLDEDKSLSVPNLLPDVLLVSDICEGDSKSSSLSENALDDNDRKLGRFLVQDNPPASIIKNERNSKLALGLHKEHVEAPLYNIPEVIVDKVTARKEPDFMEELHQIKLAARTTPSYMEYPYKKETFTEDYYVEEPITEVLDKEVVADVPVAAFTVTTNHSNTIEKETNIQTRHKSDTEKKASIKKDKNRENKVDSSKHTTAVLTSSALSTSTFKSTPVPKIMCKGKIKREKELIPNTSSKIKHHKGTIIDGMLNAM